MATRLPMPKCSLNQGWKTLRTLQFDSESDGYNEIIKLFQMHQVASKILISVHYFFATL